MKTVYESKRGCGYRKPGGLYLFGSSQGRPCCQLPIKLSICPCCGGGIKFTRGFQWVSPELLGELHGCIRSDTTFCPVAYLKDEKIGLMWVGGKFYPTPDDFIRESTKHGVSKRISTVPKDLVVGKTWVALAHKKAILNEDGTYSAGIFQLFKPVEVQYVATGEESQEEVSALEKRGITPVIISYEPEEEYAN